MSDKYELIRSFDVCSHSVHDVTPRLNPSIEYLRNVNYSKPVITPRMNPSIEYLRNVNYSKPVITPSGTLLANNGYPFNHIWTVWNIEDIFLVTRLGQDSMKGFIFNYPSLNFKIS